MTARAVAQSKKRGLSLEEKRQCILQVFHESRDVFTLKVTWNAFNKSGLHPGHEDKYCSALKPSLAGYMAPSENPAGHGEAWNEEGRHTTVHQRCPSGGSAPGFLCFLSLANVTHAMSSGR